MKIPQAFIPNDKARLDKKVEELLKGAGKQPAEVLRYTSFEVITVDTYVMGIAELKELGKRPFTFSENIEARLINYEVNGENARLFGIRLDSVTGIVYKAGSTKFKVVLRSDKLENIPLGFSQSVIPVDYDAEQGVELDSTEDKYDQRLTREEAKNHKFWLAVMNNDKEKLVRYVNLWFDKTGKEKGMGVYLRGRIGQDELWALVIDGNSSVVGGVILDGIARFVSITQ